MDQDQFQVLYHLSKSVDSYGEKLDDLQTQIHNMSIDIAIMKQNGLPVKTQKAERLKDGATGGSVGAVIVTVLIALFEYFKTKI